MTNDKLPEEIQAQVKRNAKHLSGHSPDEDSTPFKNGFYSGYLSGATAWAPWKVKHDELSAENSVLRQKNIHLELRLSVCEKEVYDHRSECQQLQAQAQRMADALEQVKSRLNCIDNANEIVIIQEALQQFKDGGKEVENAKK